MSNLILLQYDESLASRTFFHYDNEKDLVKHMVQLAKEHKHLMKGVLSLNIPLINDLEALTIFIYSLYDFGYYENKDKRYIPYGKVGFINKATMILDQM